MRDGARGAFHPQHVHHTTVEQAVTSDSQTEGVQRRLRARADMTFQRLGRRLVAFVSTRESCLAPRRRTTHDQPSRRPTP